jgi:hypothetical protein
MNQIEIMQKYDETLSIILRELVKINAKIDAISEGPIFRKTQGIYESIDKKCDYNLQSLNTMILQVKGIVSQVNSLRGKKSDWDNDEINVKRVLQ